MDIKVLRDEFAKLHSESNSLIEIAAKDKRGLSSEETAENDKRFSRMDEIQNLVKADRRLASYAFHKGEVVDSEPKGKAEFISQAKASRVDYTAKEIKDGINEYLRTGDIADRQLFGLITTSGSSAALPTVVAPPVTILTPYNPYKAALIAKGYTPITTGNTASLTIPTFDDSGNIGATKTEGATSETTPVDATVSSISLATTLKESKPSWFSNSLVNANSNFDILSYITPFIFARLERSKHSMMDVAIKAATTSITTCASASAVTYAEVLTWEHSLGIAYRNKPDLAFFVSDSFYKLLRGLVDSNSRPIFDLDPVNVFQERLHGIPVYVSEYLSAVATTAKVGAIVNVPQGLFIREEQTRVTRYVNVPSYPDQVGYNLFQDAATAVNGNAVRLIKMG